jgi:hypothetical protein
LGSARGWSVFLLLNFSILVLVLVFGEGRRVGDFGVGDLDVEL